MIQPQEARTTGSSAGMGPPSLVELARRYATLNHTTICVLFSNHGWSDFTYNFLLQVRAAGIRRGFLVYAWDGKTCAAIGATGPSPLWPCIWEGLHVDPCLEKPQNWATDGYNQLINSRFDVMLRLLKAGLNVFAMDTDAVLLRNPFEYLDPALDVQAQQEMPVCGYVDGCLNGGPVFPSLSISPL